MLEFTPSNNVDVWRSWGLLLMGFLFNIASSYKIRDQNALKPKNPLRSVHDSSKIQTMILLEFKNRSIVRKLALKSIPIFNANFLIIDLF